MIETLAIGGFLMDYVQQTLFTHDKSWEYIACQDYIPMKRGQTLLVPTNDGWLLLWGTSVVPSRNGFLLKGIGTVQYLGQ